MSSIAQLPKLLERCPAQTDANEPLSLQKRRQEALDRFVSLGFPTGKEESWRSTPTRLFSDGDFKPASASSAAIPEEWKGAAQFGLTFLNGNLLEVGSQAPSNIQAWSKVENQEEVFPVGPQTDKANALSEANAALFKDAAIVRVDTKQRLENPIFILHLIDAEQDTVVFPRSRIDVGRLAEATVIEVYVSLNSNKSWVNAATEIDVQDGACLTYIRYQDLDANALITGHLEVRTGQDAKAETLNLDFGSQLARLNSAATLDGTGSWCRLDGLVLAQDTQHIDNQTVLDHAKPHCDSRELYKNILSGRARTVFNGRIIVREDAQKTDAKQSNPSLLLSDEALAHTRPQLEIYADDVRCTHGATVGRLDENAEFYLRTRGVPKPQARQMLVNAFASEVLELLPEGEFAERIIKRMEQKLKSMSAKTD